MSEGHTPFVSARRWLHAQRCCQCVHARHHRLRFSSSHNSYSEAIDDLSAALALKPKYKVAVAQRAKLYRLLGKCDESRADYLTLQALDPKHAVS